LPNVTTTIAPGENGPDEAGTGPDGFRLELVFSRREFAGMERLSPPQPKLATATSQRVEGLALPVFENQLCENRRCGNQPATLE